jgi:hypothetical protein
MVSSTPLVSELMRLALGGWLESGLRIAATLVVATLVAGFFAACFFAVGFAFAFVAGFLLVVFLIAIIILLSLIFTFQESTLSTIAIYFLINSHNR